MNPIVFQINKKPDIKGEAGLPKISTEDATVTKLGLKGDCNNFRKNKKANDPDMALMILSHDIINNLNTEGWPVKPGDLGENITLSGIDYSEFAPLKKYTIGKIEIEISFACDPCMTLHHLPYIGKEHVKFFIKTLMKRRGWYARVLKPGEIKKGDPLTLVE